MRPEPQELFRYRRSRFSARLPVGHRYTRAHYWLAEAEPGLWRIGFTRFATRMLGDMVEYAFEVEPGAAVVLGQAVGSVEGFKAITNVYCVAEGEFAGTNPEIERDITRIDTDPHGRGWLYEVRGRPDPESVSIEGYVAILDATIDRMLQAAGEGDEAGHG